METENRHIDPVGLLPKVFAGEATLEENRIVDEWIKANPANRAAFDDFASIWKITEAGAVQGEIDLDREWKRMDSAISSGRSKTIHLARILQLAASIVLLSALAFAGIRIAGTRSDRAPRSAVSVNRLPDGTTVSLNAGSKITYARGFGITHRNLTLKGEAYFEVKKGSLPFMISAGGAVVKVAGTRFNVRAYTAAPLIRVTVTEGIVSLYDSGRPAETALLAAGETGLYDKSLKTVNKLPVADVNDLAWKTRIIDLRNTPLYEVAEILANTYHLTVDTDPAMRNCSVTVRFENQELDAVIEVLRSTLDLKITRKDRHISISGKGC